MQTSLKKKSIRSSDHYGPGKIPAIRPVLRRTCGILLSVLLFLPDSSTAQITTGSLLEEMTDPGGLTEYPENAFVTVQFSSYDRHSTTADEPGWFANSDGFGGESTPGFEQVLKEPGGDGVGRYLICDVEGPGAIVRLWTALITGKIEFFLDDGDNPFYQGPAQDFFLNTYDVISGKENQWNQDGIFRQNMAGYYPIPFQKRCKIIWEGKISELHFYHVQVRKYDPDVRVETFSKRDLKKYSRQIEQAGEIFKDPQRMHTDLKISHAFSDLIEPQSGKQIFKIRGGKCIQYLMIRPFSAATEKILRQAILRIGFDGASSPQVEAPLGDFFGAAPGINPYHSLPFSVLPDGSMICRFHMPFRDSAEIEIENMGDEPVHIYAELSAEPYSWKPGKSMYFRARWRIDHGLTASPEKVQDIPYLVANGKGVCVGAAAYIYNPTNVPSSYGNWWGEGDEKIFTDQAPFPAFFGTGSEDYFNYAWSSSDLFAHPYCGQPRNDGPANRGFVSNYRWHIIDQIPFQSGISFYMELFSHEPVENFSYGRMVYLYGLPGIYDDHLLITRDDVRHLELPEDFYPVGAKGSANARFFQAEALLGNTGQVWYETGRLWSGGKVMVWDPESAGESLTFSLPVQEDGDHTLVFTCGRDDSSGSFRVKSGDDFLQFGGSETIHLNIPYRKLSQNFRAETIHLQQGINEIQLIPAEGNEGLIKIDFIWLMKNR